MTTLRHFASVAALCALAVIAAGCSGIAATPLTPDAGATLDLVAVEPPPESLPEGEGEEADEDCEMAVDECWNGDTGYTTVGGGLTLPPDSTPAAAS